MIGTRINMWDHVKRLGEKNTISLWKLVGRDRSGGYSIDVFENNPPRPLEAVIRPWQQDMVNYRAEGQTGHTPGFKMYTSADAGVARNDRVHWNGEEFRVVNPQHDEFQDITRWDLRTDERELIHEGEVEPGIDLEPPDRSRFGGY